VDLQQSRLAAPSCSAEAEELADPLLNALVQGAALAAGCSSAVVHLRPSAQLHGPLLCDCRSAAGTPAGFHAAFALRAADDSVLGALCVLDDHPRTLTGDQTRLLEILAGQVTTQLDQRRQLLQQAEAATALAESERLYRMLAEHSTDIISKHDLTGHVQYVSPSVRAVLGYDPVQEISSQPAMLVHPEDLPTVGAALGAAREGTTSTVTVRSRHADGSWRHLEMTLSPVRDASGVVTELYSAARDVTERVDATNRLARQQDQLYGLLTHSTSVIFAKDREGRYLLANPTLTALTGRSAEQMLGHSDDEVWGREASERFRQHDQQVLDGGRATLVTEQFRHPDGQLHSYLATRFPLLDASGEPYAVAGIATDITELEHARTAHAESSRRYAELVQTLPDALLVHVEGVVSFANPAAAAMFGADEQHALVGLRAVEFSVDHHDPRIAERIRRVLDGQHVPREQQQVRRLDGRIITVEVHASRVEFDGSAAVQVVLRDISAQVEAEQTLRVSEQRLAALFSQSPVGQAEADIDGTLLAVNPALADLLAASGPETLVGRQIRDLLEPGAAVRLREQTAALLAGGATSTRLDCRMLRSDAQVVHVILTVGIIRGFGDQPHRLLATVFDVTERNAALSALEASHAETTQARAAAESGRAFLETVLETIDVGIVACDGDGHLTLFNDATRAFHGMPVDPSLDPADWTDHFDLYCADGTTLMTKEQVPLYRALVEGQITDVAMMIKAEGQPARMMRCDGRALHDGAGTVIGAVVAMKDVTASLLAARQLEQAHASARAIVTTSTDAFVSIDETGCVTDWNPQAEKTFGYCPADAIGRDMAELLIPPERIAAHRGGIERFLRTGQASIFGHRLELTTRHRDGHSVPIELTVWPTRIDGGWRFNAFMRDISERLAARTALDRAQAELAERAEFVRVLLDTVDVAIVACDAQGVPNYYNAGGRLLFGLPAGPSYDGQDFPLEQIRLGRANQRALDMNTGEQLTATQRALPRALREGTLSDLELEIDDCYGVTHRMLTHARALHAPDGSLLGAVCAAHDVTGLRERERALQASETRFRAAFANGPLAMARLDIDGQVLEPNPAMRRLLSLTTRQLRTRNLLDLTDADDRVRAGTALSGAVRTGSRATELRLIRADRQPLWCEVALTACTDSDGTQYVLAQVADMTDRKRHEQNLVEASLTDALTGLRNREALNQHLQQWLAPDSPVGHVALLFADLDDFKLINDTLGHEAGDAVLTEVARRLLDCVRPGDLVVRLGGDEFVVACTDLPGDPQLTVTGLTDRLTVAVSAPMTLGGSEVSVGVSIGSAVARPGQDATSVLAEADKRMYQRKDRSRTAPALPSSIVPVRRERPRTGPAAAGMDAGQAAQRGLGELVSSALPEGRLFLEYQPILDLSTSVVIGVEALLRMRDRQGRVISPDRFVPLAEASGAIVEIGEWVLEQSLAQTVSWKRTLAPDRPFCIGINVSPRQFEYAGAIDRLRGAILRSALRPDAVVFEVTEGALLADTAGVREALDSVREVGVHLAVDDFGTGFASLNYLLTLPFTHVKIDRSYTSMLPGSDRSAAIAKGLLQMAVTSGLGVIAEGIETVEQRRLLLEAGCPIGQGFLFSRPQPPDVIRRLLHTTLPAPRYPATDRLPHRFGCEGGPEGSLSSRGAST
jgi:diguanylate cyclase (GGDEF)-like protein/PAS domain S-box-containing protein